MINQHDKRKHPTRWIDFKSTAPLADAVLKLNDKKSKS